MLDATLELPDAPITEVILPSRIRNTLAATRPKSPGDARQASESTRLSFQDFGTPRLGRPVKEPPWPS
jgi:hypothetical protein